MNPFGDDDTPLPGTLPYVRPTPPPGLKAYEPPDPNAERVLAAVRAVARFARGVAALPVYVPAWVCGAAVALLVWGLRHGVQSVTDVMQTPTEGD